jgi:hypothetical protein
MGEDKATAAPTAQVKDALGGLSPVYLAPFGGFRR